MPVYKVFRERPFLGHKESKFPINYYEWLVTLMDVFFNRVVVLKIVTLYHILVLINARNFFVKSKKK
jgi:hypothetical protein